MTEPKRYRKRQVEVEAEAVQWTGENFDEVLALTDGRVVKTPDGLCLDGKVWAHRGQWIVCDLKGNLYPVKPGIFEATYEEVGEGADDLVKEASVYLDSLARECHEMADGGGGELPKPEQDALRGKADGYEDAAEYLRSNFGATS